MWAAACGRHQQYWAMLQHHLSFLRTRRQVAARATQQWLSAHLCQADTETMTVNQLTLHFLGRHEWEIKIAASAMYIVPQTHLTLSLIHTHKHTYCTHSENESLLHCSSDHSWALTFSHASNLRIYQSSYRKDASLTFPIMSIKQWCWSQQKQSKQIHKFLSCANWKPQ